MSKNAVRAEGLETVSRSDIFFFLETKSARNSPVLSTEMTRKEEKKRLCSGSWDLDGFLPTLRRLIRPEEEEEGERERVRERERERERSRTQKFYFTTIVV